MSAHADWRLCTQQQLDAMCRSGADIVHEGISSGDPATAADATIRVLNGRNEFVRILGLWTASTLAYVLGRAGEEAMAATIDAEEWLSVGVLTGITPEEVMLARRMIASPQDGADRIAELVAGREAAAAEAHWLQIEQAGLKVHDYRRDCVTAALSQVYRTFGADGLNEAQLHAAEQQWWIDAIDADLAADPVTRVATWAFHMAVANFGRPAITEEHDRFVIHHRVCGSCGRQELDGRYEPPFSFPRVGEDRPELTLGRSDDTIYRTHLATLHFSSQIARVGHPWPIVDCSGVPGRCWFGLYKDPTRTPDRYYEMAGAARPARDPSGSITTTQGD